MSRARVIDFLPTIYGRFLPDWFEAPMGEERHATCASCAMCPPPDAPLGADAYFSPSTKCCTFQPALPNYSVGGLLADASPEGMEGRRRIQQRIADRIGVTPAGILVPRARMLLQQHSPAAFGRAEALVCPYLDRTAGACTVWAHREAECATWFCKHNHGVDGRAFWQSLRDYLVKVHVTLSQYVLRELRFDPDRIGLGFGGAEGSLTSRDLDGVPPAATDYAEMWGGWCGREHEFYHRAFELVQALDRPAFRTLVGIEHAVAIDRLAKRHRDIFNPVLPDPLKRNPHLRVVRAADGHYLLSAGEKAEPTRLRRNIFLALDEFDGRRSNAEVQAHVRHAYGFGLSDQFLIALYHHRIVVGG